MKSHFEKSLDDAQRGILKISKRKYQEYIINVGTNSFVVSLDDLASGVTLNQYFSCNNKSPYTLRLDKGVLKLSAKFYNLDNEIVGEIEDNEWSLNNNHYKMNFDSKAVEVIDNYDVVVMQIVARENIVSINGILHCDEVLMVCNGESIILQGLSAKSEKSLIETSGLTLKGFYLREGRKLERIFDYSGNDWIGKRNINVK